MSKEEPRVGDCGVEAHLAHVDAQPRVDASRHLLEDLVEDRELSPALVAFSGVTAEKIAFWNPVVCAITELRT